MRDKIQLYILTGFLGSGKTTILMKLLESVSLSGCRIGVIQNEFGKLSIDGEIMEKEDIQMVEINRGSIFCSCLRKSFVEALTQLAAQNLDYLFVESSGLGDPSNVEEILAEAEASCGDVFALKGTICLVDAVHFLDQIYDLETVNRQLKHCHMAVITKTDLVNSDRLDEIQKVMRSINPVCRVALSANGDLDLSFLEEDLLRYRWAESEATTNSTETKPKTLFMDFEGEAGEEQIKAFLLEICDDLYRAKGFFRLRGIGWNRVDLVGHKIDVQPCEEKKLSQFVFISKIGPKVIKSILDSWEKHVGTPMRLRN